MSRVLALVGFVSGCTCRIDEPRPIEDTSGSLPTLDTSVPDPEPTADTGPDEPLRWAQADTGGLHSCGLLSDGRVICWGKDECVAAAPGPEERFVQISEGNGGGCHLREDGTISCMCCYPGDTKQEICDEIPPGRFVEVRVGSEAACALDEDRRITCWGNLWYGPLNLPTEPLLDFSMDVEGGCGIVESGAIVCWADQLMAEGEGPPPGVKFTRIAPGRTHACALGRDQNIYCWGHSGIEWPSVPFPDPPPGPYVGLESFNQISCGFRPDRSVECWYDFPQLDDLDDIPPEADGTPSWAPPDEPFAQIGLGEWDACGVTLDGELRCWPAEGDTEGEVGEAPSLEDVALP